MKFLVGLVVVLGVLCISAHVIAQHRQTANAEVLKPNPLPKVDSDGQPDRDKVFIQRIDVDDKGHWLMLRVQYVEHPEHVIWVQLFGVRAWAVQAVITEIQQRLSVPMEFTMVARTSPTPTALATVSLKFKSEDSLVDVGEYLTWAGLTFVSNECGTDLLCMKLSSCQDDAVRHSRGQWKQMIN